MRYHFRIRGEQCSAELGFRHWFLASPQAGLGKLCRFVWLPLWFLLDEDSDAEGSGAGTMVPTDEEGIEDDNVSTSTHEQSKGDLCVYTCLCSKESLCSDTSNIVCVNSRPRRGAMRFPCLSSPFTYLTVAS